MALDISQHLGKSGAAMRAAMAGVREEQGVGVPHPIASRNTAMDTVGRDVSGPVKSRPGGRVKPVAYRNTSGAAGGPYSPPRGR